MVEVGVGAREGEPASGRTCADRNQCTCGRIYGPTAGSRQYRGKQDCQHSSAQSTVQTAPESGLLYIQWLYPRGLRGEQPRSHGRVNNASIVFRIEFAMAEEIVVCQEAMANFKKWRSENSDEAARAVSDGCLKRYLIARRNKLNDATQMLLNTLDWQKQALAEPLCCEACDSDATSHCFWPVGSCRDQSIGIYGCPPRASQTAVEPTVKHVQHYLEHAYRTAEKKGLAAPGEARWTWLVDFNGFGMTHAMQARLGISFAQLFSQHHPERLQRLILFNPPTVFSILLAAIQPFADARTLSKVVTIRGSPGEMEAQLVSMQVFEQDTPALRWLTQTLAMKATPGNLPPLPEGAEEFIPRRPDRKSPENAMK